MIAAAVILGLVFFLSKKDGMIKEKKNVKIIEENLLAPDTKGILGNEGMILAESEYKLPIKDSGEIIVSKAALAIRAAYDQALPEAGRWADDSSLVFIKSLGAVTPEGESSQWQIVFGSKKKKAGYEIIIQADMMVSEKEIESKNYGYGLPENWYDSGEAIASLSNLPQFSGATISAINFFYNNDAEEWRYAIATSFGNTSMRVK